MAKKADRWDYETIPALKTAYRMAEHDLVAQAIAACEGRLSEIAGYLEVSKATVQRLVERHGLQEEYAARSPGRGRPGPKEK